MISGVLGVLLGESALFASLPLLLWFAMVLAVNAVYFPLVEEPALRGGSERSTTPTERASRAGFPASVRGNLS